MKAIVQVAYGSPDGFELREVDAVGVGTWPPTFGRVAADVASR